MDPAIARLLDANANRAREGLRVMEDHARFVLADAALAERIKHARHELSSLVTTKDRDTWLDARDAIGDVGRNISTPQEQTRDDASAVAVAAARRVGEALRCLEEYTKCHDAGVAARFEALRYTAYGLEQSLLAGGPRRVRLRNARLYVLITESVCRGPWLDAARSALAGGADVLQLREKSLPDRELLARASALRDLTSEAGGLLIVNDRPDIARLADADGVHVGQDDLPIESARAIVGSSRVVGISTHSIDQARAAIAESPDYIAVGPMFASKTKPQSHVPGPPLLTEIVKMSVGRTHHLVAIGGIDAQNVSQLVATGCRCVAVCTSVIGAHDIRAAADGVTMQLRA